jgi:hypothetical protein
VLQVQRPIDETAVDRWREFEHELAELSGYLRDHGVLTGPPGPAPEST